MATTWAHLANLREQNDQHCTSELQSYKSQVAILHCPSFCAGAQWHTEEKQGWSSIVKHLQSMCSVLGPIPESHIKEKKANSEPIFKNTITLSLNAIRQNSTWLESLARKLTGEGFLELRVFYKMRIKKVTQLKTLSELNIYTKWIYLNCKIPYSLCYSSKIFSLHFFQSYGPLKQLRKNKSLLLLYVNGPTLITENM